VTGLSSASLYAIIKDLAGKASEKLDVSSAEYQQLNNMSPHWLRHTAITQLANAKTRDRYLQAFARHSKRETTEIYITDDAEQFHDEISGR
jgi:integrase